MELDDKKKYFLNEYIERVGGVYRFFQFAARIDENNWTLAAEFNLTPFDVRYIRDQFFSYHISITPAALSFLNQSFIIRREAI